MDSTPRLPDLPSPFAWRENRGIVWIGGTFDGTQVAFTTRLGGISEGSFRSLNLGKDQGDESARVFKNRRRLARGLGFEPTEIALGRQVHSSGVRSWTGYPKDAPFDGGTGFLDRVDGHVTSVSRLALMVLVADCVPVALAGVGTAAIIHCGWRGTAAGVVGNGLASVAERAGRRAVQAVRGVTAVVGPSIGPCCYEVGESVADVFDGMGHGEAVDRKGRLDLPLVVMRELARLGVDAARVHHVPLCTRCEADLFFSHRRDGETGRQAGIVWRT